MPTIDEIDSATDKLLRIYPMDLVPPMAPGEIRLTKKNGRVSEVTYKEVSPRSLAPLVVKIELEHMKRDGGGPKISRVMEGIASTMIGMFTQWRPEDFETMALCQYEIIMGENRNVSITKRLHSANRVLKTLERLMGIWHLLNRKTQPVIIHHLEECIAAYVAFFNAERMATVMQTILGVFRHTKRKGARKAAAEMIMSRIMSLLTTAAKYNSNLPLEQDDDIPDEEDDDARAEAELEQMRCRPTSEVG